MSDTNLSCQPLLDRLTHVMFKTKTMRKFMNFKNLEEKIAFCLSNENIKYDESTNINIRKEISDLLQVFYSNSTKHLKSEEDGNQMKLKGSKAFMKKKDKDAFKLYTDGLRHSPSESLLLPILFANRSATHFQMKKYKECLEDIERAEKADYPPEARYKLYKRKIEALVKLGRTKEAQCTLKRAKGCAIPSGKDFLNSLEELENQIIGMNLEERETSKATYPLPILFKADNEKQMSGTLEIRENKKDGRHICARSDIPPGSALFTEKPFAAILLPEYFLTHCQGCFSPLANPIPCRKCCDVLWCSEKCRTNGEKFHKYECGNLHILTSVGIAHLALRIIIIAGWPICKTVKEESKKGCVNVDTMSLFHSKDKKREYEAVFSLLNHLEKASLDDQFQYSLAAIVLADVIIEKTDFFGPDNESSNQSPVENIDLKVEVASILVHHISQLVSNAHAITQIEGSIGNEASSLSQISQRRIASAIYPLASLMNHSCKPSIINSFQGDILVIHSIQRIKNGEQIYNCYGPHACRQEREERQAALDRQYFFHCQCLACADNELIMKEASWSGIMCPKCSGIALIIDEPKSFENDCFRCLECRASEELPQELVQKCSELNNQYDEAQEFFKNGKYEAAEILYVQAVRSGEHVFAGSNEFLNTMRDDLAKCYAVQGKFEVAIEQLSFCLKTVGNRFGEDSVEMAHELLKYLDVIRMAGASNPMSKKEVEPTRKRIVSIFTLHYGVTWEHYLKLEGV